MDKKQNRHLVLNEDSQLIVSLHGKEFHVSAFSTQLRSGSKNSNHLPSQSKAIMALDHSRLKPGKEFIPKQNNPVAHLQHLYFVRLIGQHKNLMLCYKGQL